MFSSVIGLTEVQRVYATDWDRSQVEEDVNVVRSDVCCDVGKLGNRSFVVVVAVTNDEEDHEIIGQDGSFVSQGFDLGSSHFFVVVVWRVVEA